MDIDKDVENLEEDTKYKIKLAAPKSEPAFDDSGDEGLDAFDDAPADEEGFGGFGDEEGASDEPFDDTPFDAGVEADEDEDPEKYIQQLAGKLGTSLRKYNDERGEPDFDLEKYAVNSVISATHTSEMDEEDQKEIIRKVKTSGAADDNDDIDKDLEEPTDDEEGFGDEGGFGDEEPADDGGFGDETNLDEIDDLERRAANVAKRDMQKHYSKPGIPTNTGHQPSEKWPKHTLPDDTFADGDLEDIAIDVAPRTLGTDYDEISDEPLYEEQGCWKGYKRDYTKEKYSDDSCEKIDENRGETNNYMFWQNLKTIIHASRELLEMDFQKIDALLSDGHGWALDHIATSADDIEEVYHFLEANLEGYEGEARLNEAEYKGETVTLNNPTRCKKGETGCKKKFKVFVKNDKGNVVKVQFGDPNMEIKRDDEESRKNFRARHNCADKKDKTTAGYWSCKMWSGKNVSDLTENLKSISKNSTFVKNKDMKDLIKGKLDEMSEPATKPAPVKTPTETPTKKPRRTRIFQPNPGIKTPAKMDGDGSDTE
jgi:hypothetical protein